MKCKKCGRQVLTWAKGQPLTWGCDQCREVALTKPKPAQKRRRIAGAKCVRRGCKNPARVSVHGLAYRFCSPNCRYLYHAYESPRVRAQKRKA